MTLTIGFGMLVFLFRVSLHVLERRNSCAAHLDTMLAILTIQVDPDDAKCNEMNKKSVKPIQLLQQGCLVPCCCKLELFCVL